MGVEPRSHPIMSGFHSYAVFIYRSFYGLRIASNTSG